VLALMAEGRSNAEIGAALVITDSAVSKHINSIFAKLGLHPATPATGASWRSSLPRRRPRHLAAEGLTTTCRGGPGWCPRLVEASSAAMSASGSVEVEDPPFSAIRSWCADLGMTGTPCCTHHGSGPAPGCGRPAPAMSATRRSRRCGRCPAG